MLYKSMGLSHDSTGVWPPPAEMAAATLLPSRKEAMRVPVLPSWMPLVLVVARSVDIMWLRIWPYVCCVPYFSIASMKQKVAAPV